ncbi:EamA family transporter [Nitrospira sp. Nam74]
MTSREPEFIEPPAEGCPTLLQSAERNKIIALLGMAVVSQAIGNVLLSQGMKSVATLYPVVTGDWLMVFLLCCSPSILFGLAFVIVSFVLFATTLSRADLSFALPLVSSEVVVNVAFAKYFLQETVSPTRWLGAVLISIGVVLVLRSSPRTFAVANEPVKLRQEIR